MNHRLVYSCAFLLPLLSCASGGAPAEVTRSAGAARAARVPEADLGVVSGAASVHAREPASEDPLGVEEAVRLALANSEELRALAQETAAARELSGAAGALPDPEARLGVEGVPSGSPRDGEEWTAGLSQTIPLGGARAGGRDAATASVHAAEARRAAAAANVERRVRAVHAAGLAQDQALEFLGHRLRLAQTEVERTRLRIAAGAEPASALDEARIEAAHIEHEIEDAKHARAAQTRALSALLGAGDAARPLAGALDEAFDLPALEDVLRGLEGLPALREAEAEAALAAARARVASAARLPLLRLDAGWRERADGRSSIDLALGFTIPWSGSASARARAADLEASAQRARSIQTARELALAVADAHDGAVLALHRLEIHDEVLIPAAERQLARNRARVSAGDAAPTAVSAAEDALLLARLERLTVWADLAAAWADLGALLMRAP